MSTKLILPRSVSLFLSQSTSTRPPLGTRPLPSPWTRGGGRCEGQTPKPPTRTAPGRQTASLAYAEQKNVWSSRTTNRRWHRVREISGTHATPLGACSLSMSLPPPLPPLCGLSPVLARRRPDLDATTGESNSPRRTPPPPPLPLNARERAASPSMPCACAEPMRSPRGPANGPANGPARGSKDGDGGGEASGEAVEALDQERWRSEEEKRLVVARRGEAESYLRCDTSNKSDTSNGRGIASEGNDAQNDSRTTRKCNELEN